MSNQPHSPDDNLNSFKQWINSTDKNIAKEGRRSYIHGFIAYWENYPKQIENIYKIYPHLLIK